MKRINSLTAAIALSLIVLASPLFAETAPGSTIDTPIGSITTSTTSATPAAPPVKKRFWRATSEMIVIGYSPWLYSHYVIDAEYANISIDSVKDNFEEGLWYDGDNFRTNMSGHPYQGSLYYNAGRMNGFNFWESAGFTFAGDFGWEFFMESEPPSYNDMVNTFFGGVTRGEAGYRISRLIIDNKATGFDKFFRELGAGILNPVGFFDRLVFGDLWKKKDNPPDRYPSSLFMMVDGGYSRGRRSSTYPDQAIITTVLRYNDPHEQPIRKPFDYFDLDFTLALNKGILVPKSNLRGLLAGWDIKDEADTHHMFAPGLTFNYFDNGTSAFGGQGLDATFLSRWKLDNAFELRTEAGGVGYIFAAVQTEFINETADGVGRPYDFISGGGPRLDARLRRNKVDWLRCTMQAGWFGTNNGGSSFNRLFIIDTEGRFPITESLYAGAGWSFQERFTEYKDHLSSTKSNSVIKMFLSWTFRVVG